MLELFILGLFILFIRQLKPLLDMIYLRIYIHQQVYGNETLRQRLERLYPDV